MTGVKKVKSRLLALLISVSVICVAVLIFSVCDLAYGNFLTRSRATKMIWSYVQDRYPTVGASNYGEKATYYRLSRGYRVEVRSGEGSDIAFTVEYRGGELADDYDFRVRGLTNTFCRLTAGYEDFLTEQLASCSDLEIKRAEISLAPRVKNDIPPSIVNNMEFSSSLPIFAGSRLTLVTESTASPELMAATLCFAHERAGKLGARFSDYELYGTETFELLSMSVEGVTGELIESGSLEQILRAVLDGQAFVSGSDMLPDYSGVKIDIYKK